MKKIFYLIIAIAFVFLYAACDPITDNVGIGSVVTSADQLQTTVTPIASNGQNTNKVHVQCTSAVLCQWTDGILTYVSNDTVMTLFSIGNLNITLKALNAQGDTLTKIFPVQINEMTYPVDPHWGLFAGESGKTWVCAFDIPDKWVPGVGAGGVYGNGGYLANNAPTWWTNKQTDLQGLGVANDQMTFDLNGGANFTLVTGNTQKQGDGSSKGLPAGTYKGVFSFDFSKTVATSSPPGATGGNNWSIGTLTLSGVATVSLGYQPNVAGCPSIYTYNILYLDDNVMILACPEPGVTNAWGTCWFWVFKRQGYTF
jgi:hypothetical protein